MLADSTEAMVRASADRSSERIDAIVEEVIAERLAEGELEECDLTLRELRTIAASFKQTLERRLSPTYRISGADAAGTPRANRAVPAGATRGVYRDPALEPRVPLAVLA